MTLNKPIAGMAATPAGKGYWLVASDGGIFAFGDARFYGSSPSLGNVCSIARTRTGRGYWIADRSGAVVPFGDAPALGRVSELVSVLVPM
jgi:hypothetical protein